MDSKYISNKLKARFKNSVLYPIYRRKIFPIRAKYLIPKLLRVHVEPTNSCNLRCKVCYSQRPKLFPPREKGFMDFELFKQIIDELSTYGYTIDLGLNYGGESLLHKRFVEMLHYAASKKKFIIGFTTNGTLLNDDVIKALIDLEINNIVISLDAVGEKHDSLRIGSNYGMVKDNIEKLVKLRGSKSKPIIAVNMTWSEQNADDISKFINHWVEIVDNVKIYPCLSEDLRFIDLTFFDETPYIKPDFCYWPFNYLAILWNGDVTTCCADINGLNVLGNIAKQNISSVWKSESYRQLRYAAVTNTFSTKSLCYKCNSWKYRFISKTISSGMLRSTYSTYGKQYDLIKNKELPLYKSSTDNEDGI